MTSLTVSTMSVSGAEPFVVSTRPTASVSPRHMIMPPAIPPSQAYFWTPEWQHWERQADIDRMMGDYYEPENVDDLINWLNADD